MENNKNQRPRREFFTLGEHVDGSQHFRFRYDGRVYHILKQQNEEETLLLEEADARKAYDAWNHIKRPERFGGVSADT